jgi:hypothetical protein
VAAVTGDQAVALVVGTEEGAPLETRTWTGIAPGAAWDFLAELLTEEVVLIAGHGLSAVHGLASVRFAAEAAEILLVPDGTPCTGVWAVLAEGLPRWREQGRSVLLADYDAELGYLTSCLVQVEEPFSPYEQIRETARWQGPAAAYDLLLGSGEVHGPAGHAWLPAEGRAGLVTIEVPGGSYVAVGGRPGSPASAEWQHGLIMLRLGLNDALLDACLAHLGGRLTGGAPILAQQLVKGQLAEIAVERLLIQNGKDDDAHERITSVDRALLRLLGGMGFRADGPGQVAHFSESLADAYTGEPT